MRFRRSAAVVAALLAATVAVLPGAGAAAAPAVVVKVYVGGTTPAASFSAADLGDTDVPPGADVPASWSIHKVLAQAGVSAASADVVGGGQSFVLSGADLDKPTSSFQDGQLPAAWEGTDRSWAIIPPRGGGDSRREIFSAPEGAIAIYAHSGPHLAISGAPDTAPAPIGKPVHFSDQAADCPDGSAPAVSWDFGDGSPPTPQATHTFAAGGTYYGAAVATCPDGAGGAGAWQLGVGGPAAGPPRPGSTATPQPTPTATSQATPTPTPRPGRKRDPGSGTPGSGPGGSGGRPQSGGRPAPTATPAAGATPTPAPAPTSAPPSAAPAPSDRRAHGRSPHPRSRVPVVRGRLISAVVPVSAASLATAPARPAPVATGGVRPLARGALPLGLLVLVALLLAGAWRERRGL